MSAPVIYLKVGDTARQLTDLLTLDGEPIDLTGATVVLVWAPLGGAVERKAATITDAETGAVSYQLTAADLAAPATVVIEWEITFPGASGGLTVPTTGEPKLRILPDRG